MSDTDQIAQTFAQHYYQIFSTNRANLAGLYQTQSMLTFEGQKFQGPTDIAEKLASLPFEKVSPQIDTLDSQPSTNGAVIIFITGRMVIDEESMPMRFSQTFQLLPNAGSYYVLNDIFRLNYG